MIINKKKLLFQPRQKEIFKMYCFSVIAHSGAIQFSEDG